MANKKGSFDDQEADDDYVEIELGLEILRVFRNMNHTHWYALAEFVDNSIDSFMNNKAALRELWGPEFKLIVDISFENMKNPAKSRIMIDDNAAGIDKKNAKRAFSPGVPPFDRTGIGRYGIGMKSSALWYSNNFIISSAALGETQRHTVYFDVDKVIEENTRTLPSETVDKDKNDHGTRIVLMDLNQGMPVGGTIAKIKSHLASIYREFLQSGDVIINVAGEPLAYTSPKALEAPYWPNDDGPGENLESIEWIKWVDIELSDSWRPNKERKQPPRVTGWVEILAKGNTKLAGLALLWHQKVIVGSGTRSEGDAYRPPNIFGTGNTYQSQRLYGHLDLTELTVTTFKDGFVWLAGQQEELEKKLKDALSDPAMPILAMSKNYRQTERSKDISGTVRKAVFGTAHDLGAGLTEAAESGSDPLRTPPNPESPEPTGGEESNRESVTLKLPDSLGIDVVFEVKDQPGDSSWLRVQPNNESNTWTIILNRAHPFMNSFVNLPGADLNPVLRIASAIAVAEIRAINAGIEKPTFIRSSINELLRTELARRITEDTTDEDD
jgi:hypothetical protein